MKEVKAAKDLPKRPFRLTTVSVLATARQRDCKLQSAQNADLAVFKDCTNVTSLFLAGDGISNEGLAHFSNCKNSRGCTSQARRWATGRLPPSSSSRNWRI